MNVCVIMFYDDNIKNYGEINYEINKKYCEKYNLKLILSNEKRLNNRHPAWERLPLLLDHILNFDYLIWIDADAFFYYDANNIIDIINKNSNVNFIFSTDISNDIVCNNVNTGIFIVKNCQYSMDFLNRWLYDEDLYKNNHYPFWWDQGVLIDMFDQNILNIKENCIQLEYGILQHFYENDKLVNKSYVYHLAGRSETVRYKESKKYFYKLKGI